MELSEIEEQVEPLESELKILLLPKDPNNEKNVIVEIRGGAGGDEATLLQVIYLECLLDMQKDKDGKWNY